MFKQSFKWKQLDIEISGPDETAVRGTAARLQTFLNNQKSTRQQMLDGRYQPCSELRFNLTKEGGDLSHDQ
ncbi:MAG: hypothetical protein BWY65_00367 [Firmicutes bacterium ADurb.Bin373]|nr:MAG: hypothetical protein BWY65_00367 [Firmicutes bacterium ADurb.Bin373]